MEWIVPILFVLATAAQWWLKRRHTPEELPPARPKDPGSALPPVIEAEPIDDFGDLLEALGRRRHESPPPPVVPSAPAPMAPQTLLPQTTSPALPVVPTVIAPVQVSLAHNPSVLMKSPARKQKTQSRAATGHSSPRIRSRLRDAVIMSEILAPPLALR